MAISQAQELAPKSGANISHFNHAPWSLSPGLGLLLWGNLAWSGGDLVREQHPNVACNVATAACSLLKLRMLRNGAESERRPNGTDCAH